jgi:hypothetical protein
MNILPVVPLYRFKRAQAGIVPFRTPRQFGLGRFAGSKP